LDAFFYDDLKLDALLDVDCLRIIGTAIDKAGDDKDATLNARALEWCEQLDARTLSGEHAVVLDYFRANALAFAGARRRSIFNTSTDIFQAGTRRYGGFIVKNENPTFAHHAGIYSEFEVDEDGVAMSSGLLRRWDFTKAETRFQTEELLEFGFSVFKLI
jgi:hypothetical protein